MKILLINGSPHVKGTSALLKDEFIRGAAEKGHEVKVFHAAQETVHPCIACDKCREESGRCVFHDAMDTLNPLLIEADLVVFVTPLYYFGMSTQLKSVIDRFYASNSALRSCGKKAVILATCGDTDDWAFDALKQHFETVCRYLKWELAGSIYAAGMYVREDIENSLYPEAAYQLGKNL